MKKLIEFGRKAMFYVRVLSGYEERRIRSYRLELQRRLQNVSHLSFFLSHYHNLHFFICLFIHSFLFPMLIRFWIV